MQLLTGASNSESDVDAIDNSAAEGSEKSDMTNNSASAYKANEDKYSSVDSAGCSTTDDSNNEAPGRTFSKAQKCNTFGELKTSRYMHRDKPPLPKPSKKRKKGSVKPTRFSQRIVDKQKLPSDEVRINGKHNWE